MKEMVPEERPREKLIEKGAKFLSNAELLAILLRTGTGKKNAKETAENLLHDAGDRLAGLSDFSIERMTEIPGIGIYKAATVAAAMELGKRFVYEKNTSDKVSVTDPKQIYELMLPVMKGLSHEECWIIFLNRANYIIGKEMLSTGGMTATVLDVKIIIRKALEKKAHGIILVHNHPSGNSNPSKADIKYTKYLYEISKVMELKMLDHLIIGNMEYTSIFSKYNPEEQMINDIM